MSYANLSRKSSTPSILRKTPKPKSPGLRVRFQVDKISNLKNLLLDYFHEKTDNRDAYVDLICKIRDAGGELKDEDFIQLISETNECISVLNEELKLYVQVILILKWAHRGEEAALRYRNFMLDVCSAHNVYTKVAVQFLIELFVEVIENSFHDNCLPSEQEERAFQRAHEAIRSLLKLIPMSKDMIPDMLLIKYPLKEASAQCHLNYVHNLLNIASYEPSLRHNILSLIVSKLISFDASTSKGEIEKAENGTDIKIDSSTDPVFSMDIDDVSCDDDMKNEKARKLDYCLHRLFKFIYAECHDRNGELKFVKLKRLYAELIEIFEEKILPTCGSCHIQFILFYLISFKQKLAEDFITYLWKKFKNNNVAPIIRQATACYISGILAHGSFFSVNFVKSVINEIASWLHGYINAVNDFSEDSNRSMVHRHGAFYALCQAFFYLICSRQDELVNSNKHLRFLENLNLGKIVTCRLNPLFVCSRNVVNMFAAFTKTYQLTYCFSVLNNYNTVTRSSTDIWLDEYLPFECYVLKRSGKLIHPIYRRMREPSADITEPEPMEIKGEDEEDFIPNGVTISNSPHVPVLSSSPFFGCNLSF